MDPKQQLSAIRARLEERAKMGDAYAQLLLRDVQTLDPEKVTDAQIKQLTVTIQSQYRIQTGSSGTTPQALDITEIGRAHV